MRRPKASHAAIAAMSAALHQNIQRAPETSVRAEVNTTPAQFTNCFIILPMQAHSSGKFLSSAMRMNGTLKQMT